MNAAIATERLTKDYGTHRALDGLTLSVQPGEIFGFLGPNGAGKTTTIRLLLDLIRPTSGHAGILGMDCRRRSEEVRACVGYLPGDLRLYPNLRGSETIDLFAGLRPQPVDRAYARHLANRLDLDLEGHVGTYSKGTRQKLGVILALMARPAVLLLDEPTSGLDPVVQHLVWEILRGEAARGTAVFFSSHVLSEVEHTCERVAILRGGRLVTVAPVVDLMSRAPRRLEVTFAEDVPGDAFAMPQVRELRREHRTVWLEVRGHLDEAVKAVSRYTVLDLRTEQPGLEEILLGFYEKDAPR